MGPLFFHLRMKWCPTYTHTADRGSTTSGWEHNQAQEMMVKESRDKQEGERSTMSDGETRATARREIEQVTK